jgi:pilus assembly protein Flp/PilA
LRSDKGASAVEYSLIVVAIAAIIVLVVFAIGEFTQAQFADTCTSLKSGSYSGGPPTDCPV